MQSILSEITKLRNDDDLVIDRQNSNRYRVVIAEPDGDRTAYYFTSPIYNTKSRKVVSMKFYDKGETVYAVGSNANITIGENIRMENHEGACILSLPGRPKKNTDHELVCGQDRILPTTNGVCIESDCRNGRSHSFTLELSQPFLNVRANDKYIALMCEQFRPLVTVSCIGTSDTNGNIISPAKITYQKISDRKYIITVFSCTTMGKSVLFEVNLYEPKLFQDTTVESKNPRINNAFGGVGFIGNTNEFGEQWLYTRPEFSKMKELDGKKIHNAILHLPKLNTGAVELIASKVARRFCSFGSNWENKISEVAMRADSQITDQYINVNLMPILVERFGRLSKGDGFILKAQRRNSGFSVITTADSYFMPQILEIKYS